jgi:hypothetical protein
MLTTGVLLLHNNAQPHIENATQQFLRHFRWTILEHPPQSADLVTSDSHFSPTLKDHHSGHTFTSDDNVKSAVMMWSKLQGTEFFEAGINKLVP